MQSTALVPHAARHAAGSGGSLGFGHIDNERAEALLDVIKEIDFFSGRTA